MRKIIFIITLFIGFNIHAQEKLFCQFIMTNVDTREKTIEIDQFVRKQKVIYISRADIHSKKYLVIYYESSNIDQKTILKWMKSLNVELKCIREGQYGKDAILDQKSDCE